MATVSVTKTEISYMVKIEGADPINDFNSRNKFVPTSAVIRVVRGHWTETIASGPIVLADPSRLSRSKMGSKHFEANDPHAPEWAKPDALPSAPLTDSQKAAVFKLRGTMPFGGGLGDGLRAIVTTDGLIDYVEALHERLASVAASGTERDEELARLRGLFAGGAAFLAALTEAAGKK